MSSFWRNYNSIHVYLFVCSCRCLYAMLSKWHVFESVNVIYSIFLHDTHIHSIHFDFYVSFSFILCSSSVKTCLIMCWRALHPLCIDSIAAFLHQYPVRGYYIWLKCTDQIEELDKTYIFMAQRLWRQKRFFFFFLRLWTLKKHCKIGAIFLIDCYCDTSFSGY